MNERHFIASRKKIVYTRAKELSLEAKVYSTILISIAAYSSHYIFNQPFDRENNKELGTGWRILNRKQDISDPEWRLWFSEAREIIIPMYLAHFYVSILSNRFMIEKKDSLLFVYGILAVFYICGGAIVAVVAVISVVYVFIARFRSKFVLICSSLALFYLLKKTTLISSFENHLNKSIQTEIALTFLVFRCASVAIEKIKDPLTKIDVVEVLRYNFYIPYFFFGPLMTYNAFISQPKELTQDDLNRFIKVLLRTTFSVVTIDFLRHFVHISALPHHEDFMQTAPLVVIGCLAFVNFYFDWTKGRILYSVAGGLARSIDGYAYAPKYGKNIATIYSFSDVYIDKGLQQFICRYVYSPAVLHYSHEVTTQIIVGATSFIIVIVAEGGEMKTCAWAILSWIGLTLEFFLSKQFKWIKNKRFLAVVSGLNYWAILLFNCICINGLNPFKLYFQRLFIEDGPSGLLLTISIGYMYAFIAMELQHIHTELD